VPEGDHSVSPEEEATPARRFDLSPLWRTGHLREVRRVRVLALRTVASETD